MSRAGQGQPRRGRVTSLTAASGYERRRARSRHGQRALCSMSQDHRHDAPSAAVMGGKTLPGEVYRSVNLPVEAAAQQAAATATQFWPLNAYTPRVSMAAARASPHDHAYNAHQC